MIREIRTALACTAARISRITTPPGAGRRPAAPRTAPTAFCLRVLRLLRGSAEGALRDRLRRGCVDPLQGPTFHCTFAVTDAAPLNVNVHVCRLLPPLEQAPDQIALRPFDTLSVIDVAVVKDADPVLPTATLIPAGLEVTRSPLLPVAVTVSVAV